MAPRPPLYNSPLVEVAFEIRFNGNFAVMNGLDRLQAAIGGDFPKLLVPQLNPGDHLGLKHYQFASADLVQIVGVAINSFLFSTKRYTVFEDYRKRVEDLLAEFRKVYAPPSFTRLGLRFTNILPLLPGTLDNLHPWLDLGARAPTSLRRPVAESMTSVVLEHDSGAKLRITAGKTQQTRELAGGRHQMIVDGFVLDLDCYAEGDLEEDQEVAFLLMAHNIIDEAFFGLVTDEAKKILAGQSP